MQRARAGRNALAACNNRVRGTVPIYNNKAVTLAITRKQNLNSHLAVVKRKIHAPQGLAGGVDSGNGLAVHADNCLAVLEIGQSVIRLRAARAIGIDNAVLSINLTAILRRRTQPAGLLAIRAANSVVFQCFAGLHVVHIMLIVHGFPQRDPFTEQLNIVKFTLGILVICQQAIPFGILQIDLRHTGTNSPISNLIFAAGAARAVVLDSILGIIQAQHGRDGLLVRIAVIRCKTIAADAVHHAAVVHPVHIAACPRLNVRAVRENVRHTVLHAVLGILAQIAQTVQHACRLLTGQLLLRCKFAIANAVYHAQRRAEQHVLVLGIREGNRGFLDGFYVSALLPGAINRCRQCAEIRTGDALRIRLIDLLRHNARVPRGIHRRLGPTARRFRCRSCRYQHSRR